MVVSTTLARRAALARDKDPFGKAESLTLVHRLDQLRRLRFECLLARLEVML